MYIGQTKLADGNGSCGSWREVTDAEAIAARQGMRASTWMRPPQATALCLCIDNYSVVHRIASRKPKHGTSQIEVDEVRRLLADWPREPVDVFEGDRLQARVRWVPGHDDVEGNEVADALAKEGCSSAAPLVTPRTMPLAAAKRWRKLQLTQQYDTWILQHNARPHLRVTNQHK